MNNHQQEQKLSASWEVNAAAWTDTIRSGQVESRRVATDAAILNAVLGASPRRVLDVGCGEGWLTRALAAHGIDALGIDGSAQLIEHAQKRGGGTFRVLNYVALIDDPSALATTFDTIVCSFSLLGEDIVPLLKALRTLLVADGRLVIQTVHPFTASVPDEYRNGWRTETFAAFGGDFRAAMPWFFRTIGSWISELRQAGFQLIDCTEPFHPASNRPLSLLFICTPTDK